MVAAIAIGSIICIIAAMAGDTSQDLKTGFLVGATPRKQQYGEIIGAIVSAAAIGGILYLLNAAWEFGSAELAAPQATLMKMVTEGVMNGNLPCCLLYTSIIIPKSVHQKRIQENCNIYDFALTEEEMKRIDTLECDGRIGTDPDKMVYDD